MISPGMQFLASSWHDFYSFAPLPISNGRLDSILMFTRPTEREGRSSQWVAGNCHATMRPVRYWSWSACFGPAQLVVATFPAAVRSLVGVRDREWIIITKSLLMWCNFWSSALHDVELESSLLLMEWGAARTLAGEEAPLRNAYVTPQNCTVAGIIDSKRRWCRERSCEGRGDVLVEGNVGKFKWMWLLEILWTFFNI